MTEGRPPERRLDRWPLLLAMAVPASVYVIAVWLPSLAFGLLLRKGQRRALQPEIGAGAAQGDATPTH